MDNIIEPTHDFEFSELSLGQPAAITGGAYFTRLLLHNKPLYFECPKCLTKQGLVKSGKKIHTDLMFDHNDTTFIQWIENLEAKCQQLIYDKSDTWFQTKLDTDDIETAFTSPIKVFKSGKFYLVRVNANPTIRIFNEIREVLSPESITKDSHIISIIEVQGIKFTSRNFQIEFDIKQMMIVSPDPFQDDCFIKRAVPPSKQMTSSAISGTSSLSRTTNSTDTSRAIIQQQPQQPQQQQEQEQEQEEHVTVSDIIETLGNTHGLEREQELEQDKEPDHDEEQEQEQKEEQEQGQDQYNESTSNADNTSAISLTIVDRAYSQQNQSATKAESLEIEKETKPTLSVTEEDIPIVELQETDFSISLEDSGEPIVLKKPNEVYYGIYKTAKEKARKAKHDAILAYLEVKNIKKTYMIEDEEEDDNSDDYEGDDDDGMGV